MSEINPLVSKFIRATNPTERAAALAACKAHRASSTAASQAAKPSNAKPPVAAVPRARSVSAKSEHKPKPDDGSDVLAMVRQCGLKGFNHDERRA